MAGPDEVVRAARDAFEDAHRNRDADLAATRTPDEARAVQDNHDAALANYLLALRTAFNCGGADWEQALADARHAQAAVDEARIEAETLIDRLGAITALTGAAGRLIEAAR